MKNRHKLMFAIDRMWNRKFICILNIVLMTVSFVLIEQAAHIYNKTDNIFLSVGVHFLNNFLSVLTMINML